MIKDPDEKAAMSALLAHDSLVGEDDIINQLIVNSL